MAGSCGSTRAIALRIGAKALGAAARFHEERAIARLLIEIVQEDGFDLLVAQGPAAEIFDDAMISIEVLVSGRLPNPMWAPIGFRPLKYRCANSR